MIVVSPEAKGYSGAEAEIVLAVAEAVGNFGEEILGLYLGS